MTEQKRRKKCYRASQFTLAKLNESSPWQLFKPLTLRKTNKHNFLKMSSNNCL